MAQATNYIASQNVSVWYQAETTVGASPDNTDLTKLQTTAFSLPEASVPVEYSTARSGQWTTLANQGHHSQGTKMWTFDTTLKGTPTAILLATQAIFEVGTTGAALNNDYAFPIVAYQDGSDTTPNTFELRFDGVGSDSTLNSLNCVGCVGTGFTFAQDIGSESGELVVTINWATAYQPSYVASALGGTSVYDTATPKNIRNLDIATTVMGAQELVVASWELTCTRAMERISYQNATDADFKPFGYAMVGPFELAGSITSIRNQDTHDLNAKFYDGNTVVINIAESVAANFSIAIPTAYINEPTMDNGGAVLMQTLPFTVVGASTIGTSAPLITITAA
jgi:hypothetical protein